MEKKEKKKWVKGENPVGRPSELPQTLVKAKEYLEEGRWRDCGEAIPTIAGLSCYCQKPRKAIYEYADLSEEFRNVTEAVMRLQESMLMSEGLRGNFNPTIVKLLLTKHGYSDRVEQDINAKVEAPSLSTFYSIEPSVTKPTS